MDAHIEETDLARLENGGIEIVAAKMSRASLSIRKPLDYLLARPSEASPS